MNYQSILEFTTPGRGTRNITDAVAKAVAKSGVQTGLAHVFVQHTSCSLTITENADPDVRTGIEHPDRRGPHAARHLAGHLSVGTSHRRTTAKRGGHGAWRLMESQSAPKGADWH
jgi:secondary thiamine-phosphate synthase enzyme